QQPQGDKCAPWRHVTLGSSGPKGFLPLAEDPMPLRGPGLHLQPVLTLPRRDLRGFAAVGASCGAMHKRPCWLRAEEGALGGFPRHAGRRRPVSGEKS
ncbi:unnamed protein product, partial [Gulo gulo]